MKKQSRMMQGEQNRKTFVWMWQGIAGKRYYIVFLLIISVLLGMSGGLLALLLRNLIDHAVEGERSGFVAAGTGLVLLVILQITFRAVDRYLEEKTRSTYENIWKKRLFSELMGRSYREVTQIRRMDEPPDFRYCDRGGWTGADRSRCMRDADTDPDRGCSADRYYAGTCLCIDTGRSSACLSDLDIPAGVETSA